MAVGTAALIAAAVASAAGAGSRAVAKRKQAKAMMPEAYKRRLYELRAMEEAGGLGLSPQQRALMQSEYAAQRAGLTGDAQARQLQQAQMMSGTRPMTGRDLFNLELANQETQRKAQDIQSRGLAEADIRARKEQEQLLLELEQRLASSEAAKKGVVYDLTGDILDLGAQTGLSVYGGNQMQKGMDELYAEAATPHDKEAALRRMMVGQQFIDMSTAYGGVESKDRQFATFGGSVAEDEEDDEEARERDDLFWGSLEDYESKEIE